MSDPGEPRGRCVNDDNTHAAALIEDLFRDARKIARENYSRGDEHLADSWLIYSLFAELGVPEQLTYPAYDWLEKNHWNPDTEETP